MTRTQSVDVAYACSVLVAAGEVVHQTDADTWTVGTRAGRTFDVTAAALVELAHDEARRRREDWSRGDLDYLVAMGKALGEQLALTGGA